MEFLGWEVGQGLQKTNVYFVPPDAICLALPHLSPFSDMALLLSPTSALVGGLATKWRD